MAGIEINATVSRCLSRQIDSIQTDRDEIPAQQVDRDDRQAKVSWRFIQKDVGVKLKQLQPTISLSWIVMN